MHSQHYVNEYLANASKPQPHGKHGSVAKDPSKAKKSAQGAHRHSAKGSAAQLHQEPSSSVLVQSKAASNPPSNPKTAGPSGPATIEQTPGEVREQQPLDASLELHQITYAKQ